MKKILMILLILPVILFSGCITNPAKQVPVVKANIAFVENQGIVVAQNYTLTQGTVAYLNRPRNTEADSFPAIGARTMISKGPNSTIGPWEMLTYRGNGTYSFNIGFQDDHYPVSGDIVHISIIVVDKDGTRIGYVVENIIWK
jgi:hypothetical protein